MALDTLLRKYFTFVVLGLVAIAAYFQASGATSLFGSALVVPDPGGASVVAGVVPVSANRERPSADPILKRNPFDSVTGPVDALPVPQPTITREIDLSDPLSAPACEGVQLFIVTESSDPTWSVAAVQGQGEPHPRLRRVGDDVGGKQVAFIGFNPRQGSPALWLEGTGTLCQSMLFGKPGEAPAPAPQPAAAAATPAPAAASGAPSLPDDIASKVQKVSETEFNVDRSVVDKILENQAELMKSARIVPEQKDGKVVGIRLFGIRPDTLLGTLGMQNGDRLETINGFNMASPEKALEAYARLRTASNLNIKINRRGQPVSIDYRIK